MFQSRYAVSTWLFLVSAALAIIGVALALYHEKVRREFAGPTTITMGTVEKKGALLGSSRRSRSQWFCWVSYEFTPPDGGARRNWRLWEPGCGVSPGRPIPVQHLVADPDVNRPGGSDPWDLSWLPLFASGVTLVIAFLVRRHEQDNVASPVPE